MFRAFFQNNRRIFLDHASTTPVLPEVKREMDKYWSESFHNPSAIYKEGVAVKQALEDYRARVARVVSCGKKDVIFTSGGTESDNLAVLGTLKHFKEKFPAVKPHIITSPIEHPAISEAVKEAKLWGAEVTELEVDERGVVSLEHLKLSLKPNTCLVSVMLASNELGTIEPVANVGRVVREWRKTHNSEFPYLHTDASQAPNYLRMDIEALNADLMTLDGSKIYGPKGVGVLVVRPTAHLKALSLGGDQERGLRAGTENIPLIAGFTLALEIAARDRESESERLGALKEFFISNLDKSLVVNTPEESLPNIVSVSVPGVLAELVVLGLDAKGVMASVGSACTNLGNRESGSRVIRAIGKESHAESTVRFSFGRSTSKRDLTYALNCFKEVLERVKV